MINANHPIKNSFGVKSNCKNLVFIENESMLSELWANHVFEGPIMVLGAGYNIIPPSFFDGVVVTSSMTSISHKSELDDSSLITVEAGLSWDDFVDYAVQNSYTGLENLSLIPGTVGAAPINNIGAYGAEISEHVESVHCFNTKTGKFESLNNNDCKFSYRNSIFKERQELFIISVTFNLQKKGADKTPLISRSRDLVRAAILALSSIRIKKHPKLKLTISFDKIREFLNIRSVPTKAKREIVKAIRKKTLNDPKITGNSGCFFKCPIIPSEEFDKLKLKFPDIEYFDHTPSEKKISACWLIRSTGFAGNIFQGVTCDINRPVVLLNVDNASAETVFHHALSIKSAVREKFGINLEEEVTLFSP
ncbi:UDP-N-acetylmuramate dehydrogenase [Halopseudomonas maritima]|uniref:UDP-N-acetylmuramate dehydrogenase n=1 Tax=Halopseudomonas maritima TaxID=2918528 RepID=UPI001EEA2FAE|nr:UDP-N-acetylmuramate dehydrogenase [Halopseudomonas maritima]UJJ32055.1 UDP-N-acetylmuramate dehydrogenase [Halopseudomonas maritima]